jgi:hypothetical protein
MVIQQVNQSVIGYIVTKVPVLHCIRSDDSLFLKKVLVGLVKSRPCGFYFPVDQLAFGTVAQHLSGGLVPLVQRKVVFQADLF